MKQKPACYLQEFNRYYGTEEEEIQEVFGGTVGYTYGIGPYFLKVYDKELQASKHCLQSLPKLLQVMEYLQNYSTLQGRICYPIKAQDSSLLVDVGEAVYTVCNRIEGRSIPWERDLEQGEIRQIVQLIDDLHQVDTEPIQRLCPKESFDLNFCQEFLALLDRDSKLAPPHFQQLAAEHQGLIAAKIRRADELAARLKEAHLPFVLCHTDVHKGNLMRDSSGKLYLIDWESMILAPQEADLFAYCEAPFYGDFSGAATADRNAILYYSIRRDLEDLWEFFRSACYEKNPVMPLEENFSHSSRIIKHLKEFSW